MAGKRLKHLLKLLEIIAKMDIFNQIAEEEKIN